MDKEIEQILDEAQKVEPERERCRAFLQHIKRVAVPREKVFETQLPKRALSPLQSLFKAAKKDNNHLEHLLGEFWETMFCDEASKAGFHTKLIQRYKTHGPGHASMNLGIPGEKRDNINLPDVLVYQAGRGLIAQVDVKHKAPRVLYPDVGVDFYEDRKKLFGKVPIYYAVHSYWPLNFAQWKKNKFDNWAVYWKQNAERFNANKWLVDSRAEDWIAVELTPNLKLHEHWESVYIYLEQFKPLGDVLKELAVRGD